MPFPIPNLDDRRFDDLVAELRGRLSRQLPELTVVAPGDPVNALVDLFAWLTETVLYRANQIPERQRLAFLNLLQLPLRSAKPSRGIVAIDALGLDGQGALPPLLAKESLLKAGQVNFTTQGELKPTPLELRVLIKKTLDPVTLTAEGISLSQLREQYGVEPAAFRPTTLVPGKDPLDLAPAFDKAFHLAVCLPEKAVKNAARIRKQLAGIILNLGLAPETELDGELAAELQPRQLHWDLAWWPDKERPLDVQYLPLEQVDDSSKGGRQVGVARLRLPREADFLSVLDGIDPQYAGYGDTPPEAPADLKPGQLLFWLRLRCPSETLSLGYLAVNAVEVLGQGVARDVMLALGTGRPDQVVKLPDGDIDPNAIAIEVSERSQFELWLPVDHFAGSGPTDRHYMLDASSGTLRFGDGVRGKQPPADARIRAAAYRYGGGSRSNLEPGAIKDLSSPSSLLKVRHEWPTRGGVDAESLTQAERRIPAFLTHRDRAVTAEDFATLALDNPINPVARAEAIVGFSPGANLRAVRRNQAGVISVFLLPPGPPALGHFPRPTKRLLRDVFDYLKTRILVGTELYVLSPQYQPISVAISLEVVDPATTQQVFREVEQAILSYLWPLSPLGPRGEGWPLGRSVEINELRTQAGRVDGVEAVNGVRLFTQNLSSKVWLEVQESQKLRLTDYQLPELMAVALQSGEAMPAPPRGFAPARPGAPTGPQPIPVPVIPDLC